MGTATRSNATIYRLFAICAVLAILGSLIAPDASSHWRWLHYLTKPTATLLLLIAVLRGMDSRSYGLPIAIGLGFAAVGDFFLMLPGDYFLAGLVCFLLTHCAYIWALTRDSKFAGNIGIFALFAALAAAVFAGLWSYLPSPMRIPVALYALVLATMAAQALSRDRQLAGTPAQKAARLAALGGLFFMVSDTVLAYGRFRWNIPYNAIWVLGTYYAAQYLFARSTENDAEA
ncbi:lysoplasmalogenase [Aminobacter sp. MDW-2]|uniref:lysoplasmalogenase n=1 Tax=Aminobacter sp. MDW-2 TaxID=2666139 RepID=UPI0012B05467|nr:lysoplasmalogenase [Aminobacter sp. MDW-2]MRX31693.1 lysoplasmalogenase [Aminobacter sp. MDW-2]QNH32178.1 lysoplasmalogenase [Aminobacter sp. MDW-2]